MPTEIIEVQPCGQVQITVNPCGSPTVDLSSYALISFVNDVSGVLSSSIVGSAGGVSTVNGISGSLFLSGISPIFISQSGQTFFISGNNLITSNETGQFASVTNLGLTGSNLLSLITTLNNTTGLFYLKSNPQNYISSGDSDNKYATITNLTQTGVALLTLINGISNNTGNFISNSQTGQFYPSSNPQFYSNSGNVQNTGQVLFNLINIEKNKQTVSGISVTGSNSITGIFNINAGSNIILTREGNNTLSIASNAVGGGGLSTAVTGIGITGSSSLTGLLNITGNKNLNIDRDGNNISFNANDILLQNTWIAAKNGNDTTGIGSLNSPYLTIGKTWEIASDNANYPPNQLVYVYPGAYTEVLPAHTIPYKFLPNADVSVVSVNNNESLCGLDGEASIVRILGDGNFTYTNTGVGNITGATFINGTDGVGGTLIIKANSITNNSFNWAQDAINAQAGTTIANVVGDIRGFWSAVHWNSGDCYINANRLRADDYAGYYGVWSDTTSNGNLYVNANEVGKLLIDGTTDGRSWIRATQLTNGTQQNGGKLYLTNIAKMARDIIQDETVNIRGGEFWGNVQKIASSKANTININQTNNNVPVNLWLDFLNTEDKINDAPDYYNSNFIKINLLNSGIVSIRGQTSILPSWRNGLIYTGGLSNNVIVGIDLIDTSANTGANPVTVNSSNLTLKNCRLVASANQTSVSSSSPQTINIDGILQVNTAPSPNVNFSGGVLIIENHNNTGLRFNNQYVVNSQIPLQKDYIHFPVQSIKLPVMSGAHSARIEAGNINYEVLFAPTGAAAQSGLWQFMCPQNYNNLYNPTLYLNMTMKNPQTGVSTLSMVASAYSVNPFGQANINNMVFGVGNTGNLILSNNLSGNYPVQLIIPLVNNSGMNTGSNVVLRLNRNITNFGAGITGASGDAALISMMLEYTKI